MGKQRLDWQGYPKEYFFNLPLEIFQNSAMIVFERLVIVYDRFHSHP